MCVVPYIFGSGTPAHGQDVTVIIRSCIAISSVARRANFSLTSQCDRVIAAGVSSYEDPYAIATSTASGHGGEGGKAPCLLSISTMALWVGLSCLAVLAGWFKRSNAVWEMRSDMRQQNQESRV